MKKLLAMVLVFALTLTLAATAAAGMELYAVRDGVAVYAEQNTASTVIASLSKGAAVSIESSAAGWYSTLIGGVIGWIPAADLSTTAPCVHAWGDWIVLQASTCTKPGVRVHICSKCGEQEKQSMDLLPHSFGGWVVTREPTCTQKGLRSRWCSVCGYEYSENIAKLPHTFGDWTVIVETTDHSAGVKQHVCQVCGTIEQESFDPEGTLRRKAKGDDVREIQQLLYEQGYLKAKGVDGSYGGGTETAITMFQKDQGITPDGVAWPETIRRLHHDYGEWETLVTLSRYTDEERVRTCVECGYQQHQITKAAPVLERKQKGAAVESVQKMLNDLGYSCGKVDGSYGGKMETAWETFATEHGVDLVFDRIRPGDLDVLANAWLDSLPEESWMGQGDKDAAVNLVLTLTPAEAPDGLLRYSFALRNIGAEKCRFVMLLLNFGEDPDFREGSQVLVLDRANLKAGGKSSATGSFTIRADWADAMSVCAVGVTDGVVWSSNAVACGGNA